MDLGDAMNCLASSTMCWPRLLLQHAAKVLCVHLHTGFRGSHGGARECEAWQTAQGWLDLPCVDTDCRL